jgi:hypothetical protein
MLVKRGFTKYSLATFESAVPLISTFPYDIIEEVVSVFVPKVLVVTVAELRPSVEPLKAAPGTIPLIEDTLRAKLESI